MLTRASRLPRAVLWDMDGTLVDSAEYHYAAWHDTLADAGHELTRDEFAATFGQLNDTILRRLLGADLGSDEIQRIGDLKESRYRELVRVRGISALPGACDCVRQLRAARWRQALASSGPRANGEAVLAAIGLTELFDALASAEDVTHGKPHPEVFLVAAERVGVAPSRCVVVEDAPAGVEAGRRAGMRTIGVLNMHPHLDADRVVRTLSELDADAFERLLNG
jgi:beta-phosphoglucomutase